MSTASLTMVNIDCADPQELARFYGELLGWDVTASETEYAMITDGRTSIGFGRVDKYAPPAWPDADSKKQFHLDLRVDDLDAAEKACRALGASTPEFQPGGDQWRVLTDPAGHPFCLCPAGD